MAVKTKHAAAVNNYARSLLELAVERKQAEPIGQEMADLREIVQQNPSFRIFLSNPGVGEAEREALLDKILAGKVSDLTANFLRVLNRHGRLGLLAQIADAYEDMLDEMLGKVEVDVTVAQKLATEELEKVRQRISQALKKDAVVYQYVDESIIGGLVVRVGDRVIDASVRYQLEAMRQQLLSARPR